MSSALVADGLAAPPQTIGSRHSLRRAGLLGVGLAVLIGAAGYGYDWWKIGRFIQSTDDAYVGGDVTDLAPKVSGLIAQIAVTDNQAVHAGDLLVKIDDRDYRAALAKAAAAVEGDRATLANLDATRALQKSLIDEAAADVTSNAAQTQLARDNQYRDRTLADEQFGTLQRAETSDVTLAQSAASGRKALAALAAAKAQLVVIDTEEQEAEAALDGALADLNQAQLNLSYTEIRAPVDGTVGNRSAHLGGYATIGAQLVSIVPAHGLWVDANFKEDQLAAMQPGQPVEIRADVLPGRVFHGWVASLAPASGAVFSVLPAENATGNFTKIVQRVPVRVVLDGDGSTLGLLRPGLSVTADVNTQDGGAP